MRLFMAKFLFQLLFIACLTQAIHADEDWNEIEDGRIVHECGVALVRLKKPLSFYADPSWGVKKLMTLMEKQRNRGQDGAGIAVVKCHTPAGKEYMHHLRSIAPNAVDHLFEQVIAGLKETSFVGEAMLGHLRYATHSGIDVKFCQPFIRPHGMPCRHFALAGNFNMTNSSELMDELQQFGVMPSSASDTQIILDTLAYHLDVEYESLAQKGDFAGAGSFAIPSQQIDIAKALQNAAKHWDGGFLFCGIMGNGDAFVCRDPAGIRPGYYISNDVVFAVASEKVALMDTFGVNEEEVFAVQPGTILVFKQESGLAQNRFAPSLPIKECTFERIYFSKANDPQIYKERKALGKNLAESVFKAIGGDLTHTVFTFVPNSSLIAFQGLVEEISRLALQKNLPKELHPRIEYLITKNQRTRTFISSDQIRKTLVAQLYEVTRGIVTPEDTLVVIDDSIVRGVTLRDSLVKNLIELNPKKIIIVSSAPPVIYPDCYGIDMSQIGRFVAFQAAIALLQERGQIEILENVRKACLNQKERPASQMKNHVKEIYEKLTQDEIAKKVGELITPPIAEWHGTVEVIYQTLEGLHRAIPHFQGDWYFSGNYPTPGGFKVLNSSYLNWIEGSDARSY
jgi:amidophosphoribosyltransferase